MQQPLTAMRRRQKEAQAGANGGTTQRRLPLLHGALQCCHIWHGVFLGLALQNADKGLAAKALVVTFASRKCLVGPPWPGDGVPSLGGLTSGCARSLRAAAATEDLRRDGISPLEPGQQFWNTFSPFFVDVGQP